MASGSDHAIASIVTAGALTGAAIMLWSEPIAFAAAGCAFGVIAGPDQDIDTVTKGEWLVVEHIPTFGWLWLAVWDLYARIMPHRCTASHFPIISTALRALYLATWALAAWLTLGRPSRDPSWITTARLGGFLIGWALSDTLHWAMDGFPS